MAGIAPRKHAVENIVIGFACLLLCPQRRVVTRIALDDVYRARYIMFLPDFLAARCLRTIRYEFSIVQ